MRAGRAVEKTQLEWDIALSRILYRGCNAHDDYKIVILQEKRGVPYRNTDMTTNTLKPNQVLLTVEDLYEEYPGDYLRVSSSSRRSSSNGGRQASDGFI